MNCTPVKRQSASDFENLNVLWDKGKLKIKEICKKFSKNRAKAHRTQQKLLEKELDFLLSSPSTEETTKQISKIRKKLGTIHRQQVADVKLRSKDRFYNENEHN